MNVITYNVNVITYHPCAIFFIDIDYPICIFFVGTNGQYFQVAEPLRAMVMGAPLEDARHLAQRYDRMRQEAEAQVILL